MLEVRGLRKYFTLDGTPNRWGRRGAPMTVRAVEGVSFDVAAGEVLTVVGESGCGKTTVAKMLVGLERPSAGTVVVDGNDLSGERSPAQRRLVQLVSQNPWSALNRRGSIRHALEQPLVVHEPQLSKTARRQRVEEIIERVGLSSAHLNARPHDVSGGELARAVLARALLAQPKVIVLDEPTASLDASVKATVVNLLMDLRSELGLCLVLITHEIPIARQVADRAAVMYLGRFVETGPADEVLGDPTHPYSRMLLASVPRVEPGGLQLGAPGRGEVPSATAPPSGCPYHPRCPHQAEECVGAVPELLAHRSSAVACCRIAQLGMPERPSVPAVEPVQPESGPGPHCAAPPTIPSPRSAHVSRT